MVINLVLGGFIYSLQGFPSVFKVVWVVGDFIPFYPRSWSTRPWHTFQDPILPYECFQKIVYPQIINSNFGVPLFFGNIPIQKLPQNATSKLWHHRDPRFRSIGRFGFTFSSGGGMEREREMPLSPKKNKVVTPWKINMEQNQRLGRSFSFLNGWFECSMLIFQGVKVTVSLSTFQGLEWWDSIFQTWERSIYFWPWIHFSSQVGVFGICNRMIYPLEN